MRNLILIIILLSGGIALANPPGTFQPLLLTSNCASGTKTVVLTSGTTWAVNPCFNTSNNTVWVQGPGGTASVAVAGARGGAGGGGGAISKATNISLSGTINLRIGTVASGLSTYFNGTAGVGNNSAEANPGSNASTSTGGAGGTVVNGSGFSGGAGANAAVQNSGAAGGGAGGTNGT